MFKRAIQINGKEIKIEIQAFKKNKDFFDRPIKSSFINIFQCHSTDISPQTEIIDVQEVNSKMFAMSFEKSLIFVPLLSSGLQIFLFHT